MPVLFPRNKRLQETVETYLSLRLVRTLFSSSSVLLLSEPVSARGVVNILDKSRSSANVLSKAIGHGNSLSFIGTTSHTSPASFVSGIFWAKQLISESSFRSLIIPPQSSLMASCVSFSQSSIKQLDFNTWKTGPALKFDTLVYLSRKSKGFQHCMRVSGCLRDQQPHGNNMLYRYFWSDINGMSWGLNPFEAPGTKDFHSSCLSPQSAGAASDVSLDGSVGEEQHGDSAFSSDQKKPGDRTLKLLSGSCYMPHPDKEETGGEDAHFICVEEQAIGVADGVGGWADLGVNSGEYSRELMSHSVAAIQQEPKGSIDPSRVLEKAYICTKARGSSTACIIALTEEVHGIHAVNLGDSGFIVVREGCTIFRSPVQQHDFNFTYQLECGQNSDLPSSAQVFNLPVTPGDVIVAGTDGLFDNLYNNEVEAVVVEAIRAGLGPQATAQKIAALARQRAMDRNRQSPFSDAAQEAGYRYYGGKLDDITVVVSYVAASDA